jgi:hypothetical protein
MHFRPNNYYRMEYYTERLLILTFASANVLPFSRVCIPECKHAAVTCFDDEYTRTDNYAGKVVFMLLH